MALALWLLRQMPSVMIIQAVLPPYRAQSNSALYSASDQPERIAYANGIISTITYDPQRG